MAVAEICIQDNRIVFVHESKKRRFLAAVRDVDRVAVLRQDPANESGDRTIVLYDQNTNGKASSLHARE